MPQPQRQSIGNKPFHSIVAQAQANTAFYAANVQANAAQAAAFIVQYDEGLHADEGAYWNEQETYDDPEQDNVADEQSYCTFATGTYADHDNCDHRGRGAMYPGRASQLGAQFR